MEHRGGVCPFRSVISTVRQVCPRTGTSALMLDFESGRVLTIDSRRTMFFHDNYNYKASTVAIAVLTIIPARYIMDTFL